MTGWRVEHLTGSAQALHDRDLPEPMEPTIWVMHCTAPALVLGSAQPLGSVDLAAADATGLEVVRRRSGGGAVLLVPEDSVWVDMLVPPAHDWWCDDVARAFLPVGAVWAAALAALGVAARVHTGALVHTPWSRAVCFAGLGTGEVVAGARKLVGLSQRRVRAGARIQGVVHRRFDAAQVTELLAPVVGDGDDLRRWLEDRVGVVDRPGKDVVDALLSTVEHARTPR